MSSVSYRVGTAPHPQPSLQAPRRTSLTSIKVQWHRSHRDWRLSSHLPAHRAFPHAMPAVGPPAFASLVAWLRWRGWRLSLPNVEEQNLQGSILRAVEDAEAALLATRRDLGLPSLAERRDQMKTTLGCRRAQQGDALLVGGLLLTTQGPPVGRLAEPGVALSSATVDGRCIPPCFVWTSEALTCASFGPIPVNSPPSSGPLNVDTGAFRFSVGNLDT